MEKTETPPTRIDTLIKTPTIPDIPRIDIIIPPKIDPTPQPQTYQPPKADPVFISATMDPRAQANFQPEYPLALVRAGIEGAATVRVLIGTDGRVKAVENVNATDPAFFEATKKQAMRYWRFKPATSDGIAAESWRTMTVRFKMVS